jgi:hypothetical protein
MFRQITDNVTLFYVSECRNSKEKPERCSVAAGDKGKSLLWLFNYTKEASGH